MRPGDSHARNDFFAGSVFGSTKIVNLDATDSASVKFTFTEGWSTGVFIHFIRNLGQFQVKSRCKYMICKWTELHHLLGLSILKACVKNFLNGTDKSVYTKRSLCLTSMSKLGVDSISSLYGYHGLRLWIHFCLILQICDRKLFSTQRISK